MTDQADVVVNMPEQQHEEEEAAAAAASPSDDDLRRFANERFAEGDYDSALPLYTMAINKAKEKLSTTSGSADHGASSSKDQQEEGGQVVVVDDDDDEVILVHLCNRSACYMKMGRLEEAKADAEDAFRLSKGRNAKACFRLARAQIALREFESAISNLGTTLANIELEEEQNPSTMLVGGTTTTTADDDHSAKRKELQEQKMELQRLQAFAKKHHHQQQQKKKKKKKDEGDDDDDEEQQQEQLVVIKSIKTEIRKPSIKEFILGDELGLGNFSRIVIAKHKTTSEQFALKIIEKSKAESLAKRQHPNVYNEIQMERRVLSERLQPHHRLIIRMYHAFQDYGHLYFLNELHIDGGEMWSKLFHQKKLVGVHFSLARYYLAEIIEALQHCHKHGIVHRDLKAENVLIQSSGHIVLIDFGTAKDLVKTDLNGPEFVGTPDFMPPEAVKGTDIRLKDGLGADHTSDLWALGVLAYQLFTGHPCFSSQSPYLSFLKIERGNLYRPSVLSEDDDAWDLISNLIQLDPNNRLGANCVTDGETGITRRVPGDLSAIKNHPFFTRGKPWKDEIIDGGGLGQQHDDNNTNANNAFGGELSLDIGTLHTHPLGIRVPSLNDLCIRACGELVRKDSIDFDISDPGDNSSHDMLRLNRTDRNRVMHILEGLKVLGEPRIYRRFFHTRQEARLQRSRSSTYDYVGLTYNDHGPKSVREEEHPVIVPFIHMTNPLFVGGRNDDVSSSSFTDEEREGHIKELKASIRAVNKIRPKFVVVGSAMYLDGRCRKLVGKISETIPVILCDGSTSYSFWMGGYQFLVLQHKFFIPPADASSPVVEKEGEGGGIVPVGEEEQGVREEEKDRKKQTTAWLKEQLEQVNMGQRNTMVFVDCDPKILPKRLLTKLRKNKTLCVVGCTPGEFRTEVFVDDEEEPSTSKKKKNDADDADADDDDGGDESSSSSSSSSEDDRDKTKLTFVSGSLKLITMEQFDWKAEEIDPITGTVVIDPLSGVDDVIEF